MGKYISQYPCATLVNIIRSFQERKIVENNAFLKQKVTERRHRKVAFVCVLHKMTCPPLHAFCDQFMKNDPSQSIHKGKVKKILTMSEK